MVEVTYTLSNGFEGCEEVVPVKFPYYDAEMVMNEGDRLYSIYMRQWINDPYYVDFPEPDEFDTYDEYSKEFEEAWEQWLSEGNWTHITKAV